MHPKTIGLIAHPGKPGVGELIKSLTAEFARFSMSILLEKETAAVSGQRSDITIAQLGGKADLLVVGASGHSALYDRMVGSRADRIVHLAPCPVLVVK